MNDAQKQLFPNGSDATGNNAGRRRVSPPGSGPDTSREAAERIAPVASALAAQVMLFIADQGEQGATDQEVQQALGLSGDTERPRLWELKHCGFVRDSGTRRRSPSGRPVRVYVATEKALSRQRKQAG